MKRIAIELGGVTVHARLYEDKAPKTVDLLWKALPLAGPLHHARWSGSAAYFAATALRVPSLAVENQVSFPYPGALCLLPTEGEIVFAYAQCQARTSAGNVWPAHFGELEGDTAAFFALLAETQAKGVQPMSIRREEG